MDVKDGFKQVMLDVGCEECQALARIAGVEPGGCGASDEECRACAGRVADALAGRMMPEGMEWPRFADGEPVRIGDEVQGMDAAHVVRFVRLAPDGWTLHDGDVLVIDDGERGERVKRPEPTDTQERIEADAKKTACEYFGADFLGCAACDAPVRGMDCTNAMALDLLRRQRELCAKEAGRG